MIHDPNYRSKSVRKGLGEKDPRQIDLEEAIAAKGGCKCQICGTIYKVDVMVPDALWNAIRPPDKLKGAGLLCGSCIMIRVELKLNDHYAFELVAA